MPGTGRLQPLPPPGGGVFVCALLIAGTAAAGELQFPVDCTLGHDCFIQQHVDRDPGPGTADFTCGSLAYDGHDGTDIRVSDDAAMHAGVDVLAAAPGIVRGLRDGVPDVAAGSQGAPDVTGRECGNGVLVERADGWEFQYCHLRQGSVRMAQGETVAAGQALGQIGLSGETQFPHLHLTIRDPSDRVVDPFDARPADAACSLEDTETLWANPVAYRPGGVLATGFLDRIPDYAEVKGGTAAAPVLGEDAPALVLWAHFYGLRAGDRLELQLTSPDGATVAESVHEMDRDRATEFRAVGRKARQPWPPGTYNGAARLLRGGGVIDARTAAIEVR